MNKLASSLDIYSIFYTNLYKSHQIFPWDCRSTYDGFRLHKKSSKISKWSKIEGFQYINNKMFWLYGSIYYMKKHLFFPPEGRLLFPQTKKIFDQCPVSGVRPSVRPSVRQKSPHLYLCFWSKTVFLISFWMVIASTLDLSILGGSNCEIMFWYVDANVW